MLQMRSTFAQNHHAPEAVSLQARHAALQTGPGAGPHRARARDCAGVQGCSVPGGDTLAHAAKYLASGGSYSVGQAGPAGPASKAPVPATQTSSGSSGNSLGQKRPAGPEAKAGPGDLRSAHFCCSRCGRDLSSAGFAQRVLHVKKCAAAGPKPCSPNRHMIAGPACSSSLDIRFTAAGCLEVSLLLQLL